MDKKIALVTGAARGIGAMISVTLAKAGYYVYMNCRKINDTARASLEAAKAEGEAQLIEFDQTDPASIGEAKNSFQFDKLDLLVNNAGILQDNLLSTTEIEDWERILTTNIFGAMRVYECFEQHLCASQHPVVVSMASISGVRPRAGQNAYAVSKAMVIEWTEQMAKEKDGDILFYAISPGPVATDMIKNAPWYKNPKAFDRIPMRRYAEPIEIAEMVELLSDSPEVFKSGSNIIIDGGFTQTTKSE